MKKIIRGKTIIGGSACAAALLTSLAAPAAATPTGGMQPHIVGGTQVKSPVSWMASIQSDDAARGIRNHHMCGGALVFPGVILTAADCVTDDPSDPDATPIRKLKMHVRVGSLDRNRGGETATVKQIIPLPGWNWDPGAGKDLAAVVLDHQLRSQPVPMAPYTAEVGDEEDVLGWGRMDPSGTGSLPTKLQHLPSPVVPPAECAPGGINPQNDLCIGNVNETDGPGPGDGGGPAFDRKTGKIVGISSHGGNAPGLGASTFTSVAKFRSWVYDTARKIHWPNEK